ncbi:UDP-GlcNAc:betaGal beta-1,3-N-acetylglucosaminyltransferase-like protein 1 isoform X2 [Gigantopelta aegis]|uniref:UDP-GlcNAc:betaGal beta-1,3-N-acetylglucosaminyltransferase-like protein 1 isoform X2 n=1 Tax=Gigantopelta aegis TaxID=1735272 RepID=UPI001B88AA91|nr:UDP-GlcNAc:betaGal beta-1,3-N-acetylglucosaminyltransferase-like protein 1 isoform X2 [Gigantopelta aegis]
MTNHSDIAVSIILPVYNSDKWLDECLRSVLEQTFTDAIQLSVYNDGSQDASMMILDKWRPEFRKKNIEIVLSGHSDDRPRGVGYAKNKAIAQSRGNFLCFLDADDKMYKDRILKQLDASKKNPKAIYTSHGPTVIMPSWFMSRSVFNTVGAFDEAGKGVPEDLIFFYKHLELGGEIIRVDDCLLVYRYHAEAATFSVSEETIWQLRVQFIQQQLLHKWNTFSIWNAGKQGRKFFRSLDEKSQKKVVAFCDVDSKKISKGFYIYEESKEKLKPKIPIIYYTNVKPPIVVCVKMGLTGGGFETNLASLNLVEGKDYHHFN